MGKSYPVTPWGSYDRAVRHKTGMVDAGYPVSRVWVQKKVFMVGSTRHPVEQRQYRVMERPKRRS